MEEVTRLGWRVLAEAIKTWTGWTRHSVPVRDEHALVERFGEALALELLPLIRELEDDFYSSDARFVAKDLREMGDLAAGRFQARHPLLPEDAALAFAWCYTFDFK